MHQKSKIQSPKQNQIDTEQAMDVRMEKQKSEEYEVLGRHKNDGKKDHKGARKGKDLK